MSGWARAIGMGIGVIADICIPDPQSHHPVAMFGAAAMRLEQRMWADDVATGRRYLGACLAPLAAAGLLIDAATHRRPLARAASTAIATWAVLGASSLAREGRTMSRLLAAGKLDEARGQLSHLCGRRPDGLDEAELARAAIESMAENTADAAVASLTWGYLGGVAGLVTHRGANTLDAMVGHHNDHYENFGRAAARFDDALDWLPARLTGALICAWAPLAGGSTRQAWRIMCRDHAKHPSPNGGWCEAAMAGALGVQLGGRNVYYAGRVEHRGLLGDGPRPGAAEIERSTRIVRGVTMSAWALGAALSQVGRKSRRQPPRSNAR